MRRLDATRLRIGALITLAYVGAILYINVELKAAEPWVVYAFWGLSSLVTALVYGPVRATRDAGSTAPLAMFLFLGPLGPIALLIPVLATSIIGIDAETLARADRIAAERRGRGEERGARRGS